MNKFVNKKIMIVMVSISDRLGGITNLTEVIISEKNSFLSFPNIYSLYLKYKMTIEEEASFLNLITLKLASNYLAEDNITVVDEQGKNITYRDFLQVIFQRLI